jgi:hypothetical protein
MEKILRGSNAKPAVALKTFGGHSQLAFDPSRLDRKIKEWQIPGILRPESWWAGDAG